MHQIASVLIFSQESDPKTKIFCYDSSLRHFYFITLGAVLEQAQQVVLSDGKLLDFGII